MMRIKVLKKFLVPCTAATVLAKVDDETTCEKSEVCKPSELPVYPQEECGCGADKKQDDSSALEQQIRVLRKELWVWHDKYKGYRQKLVEKVETGKAHSEFILSYLKEEGNYLPRVGAISLGGLTGLVFGLRGGWFRRLTYTTTGSLAMAALCYPRQASEASQDALILTKKYAAITYNFIYGVKPEGLSLPTPEFVQGKLKDDKQQTEKSTVEKKQEFVEEPRTNFGKSQGLQRDNDLYTNRSRG